MTRSELADLRVRAERFVQIFSPDSAAGKIVSQLLIEIGELQRDKRYLEEAWDLLAAVGYIPEDAQTAREKVS